MGERDIFLAAVEIADSVERVAYLDQACADDAELRAKVDELLNAHGQTSKFLETPAAVSESLADQTIPIDLPNSGPIPVAEPRSGEAEFRKYLEPATRPGWLGRLAHYEIQEILGRGAFGIVAKAFDEKLHRVVAIKLMNPELATTSPPRKRFLREARTAAAVTHENIVAIYAVEEEPIPFLVMEYIPGQTLGQRMSAQGPLNHPDVLRIGQQVAAGLAAAHSANLIHRDIKPANILLTGGINERAKISDFGLARAVDDASITTSGIVAGTPLYMAPEQARGESLDHRADLFSLGSVLYQMVSGRPAFRAANTVAVLKRVCEDAPRPLDDVIPETPGWLTEIIFRLLEKKRDDRYQTAQEVADLLARCLGELEHDGKVTCVPKHASISDPQVLQPVKLTGTNSKTKTRGLLLGGVVIAATLLGLLIINSGQETPTPEPTTLSLITTADTDRVMPANPTPYAGWHGWPADAPKPAIAPFNAAQAKKHQEEWAAYLKVPVEYTNSIGMKFRLIPPGEFLMGSTPEEIETALQVSEIGKKWANSIRSEGPQHFVVITQPFYLGVTEVTQAHYEQVMNTNPAYVSPTKEDSDRKNFADHPVQMVSWDDAKNFCMKLSKIEHLASDAPNAASATTSQENAGYVLPTEAEWEYSCRAGTDTRYWRGNSYQDLFKGSWTAGNSGQTTHAVAESLPNPFGLFDQTGNVWEWVQDAWDPSFYQFFSPERAVNPIKDMPNASLRLIRGGGYRDEPFSCRSSHRRAHPGSSKYADIGFRVKLAYDAVKQEYYETQKTSSQGGKAVAPSWPADAPKPAIAPFTADEAKQHQEAWAKYLGVPVEYTNSIGMKFRLIPPGEFLMGSTPEEIEAAQEAPGEGEERRETVNSAPQHKVVLTKPFYLGVTEVSQAEYKQVMGELPSESAINNKSKQVVQNLDTRNYPVAWVNWTSAIDFCSKLSQREQLKPFYFRSVATVSLLEGNGYRLPTEAEWEFACRAGTTTLFWSGNNMNDLKSAGWFSGNSGVHTHAVGELRPNPFGLYDVHGNVWEWVQDGWDPEFYGRHMESPAVDPYSPFEATEWRLARSGSWYESSEYGCRSAVRYRLHFWWGHGRCGLRVAFPVDAVKQVLANQPASPIPN